MKLEDFFTSYSKDNVESLFKHRELFLFDEGAQFLKHQAIIANVLSPFTPFNEMLVIHEMGTGKTCTALAVAERFLYNTSDYALGRATLDKTIIITKSSASHDVFSSDMLSTCRFKSYQSMQVKELRQTIKRDFIFKTFETFTRELLNSDDTKIRNLYDNSLIIVDEAHNIRKKMDNELKHCYSQMYRLFHILRHRKILLLTGTPMKDSDVEIVHMFNLLLSEERQMSDHVIQPENINLFLDQVKMMYSFMKSGECGIVKRFVGEKHTLDNFITLNIKMSDFQSRVFHLSQKIKNNNQGIFFEPRQVSCFVFPDESYGNGGFKEYISKEDLEFKPHVDTKDIVKNLQKYSIKYHTLVEYLKSHGNEKAFIFCEFVNGSGIILLTAILKLFGFHHITSTDDIGKRKNSFVVITNETCTPNDIGKYLDAFNASDNARGDYISFVIGSRVMMETYTLKNIQHIHILSPHWNFSETSQIIGRGVRYGSHVDLPEVKHVNVYLYAAHCNCCTAANLKRYSIDLYMYELAEKKDLKIQHILYKLKQNAFDCNLMKSRNTYGSQFDMSRECEYETCDYVCTYRDKGVQSTTNQWLLTSNDTSHLQNIIIEHFIKNDMKSVSIEELYSAISDSFCNKYHFLKTLYDTVYVNKTGLPTIYGTFMFYEKDGIVYVNNFGKPYNAPRLMDIYLPKNVVTKKIVSFKRYIDHTAELVQHLKETELYKCENYEQFESLIIDLTLEYKEQMLMSALTKMEECKTKEYILKYFKLVYLTDGNLSIQWFVQNKWKTYDKYWRDSTPEECDIVHEFRRQRRHDIASNEYGVFGFININNGIFCIRYSKDESGDVTDKRKIRVGKNCSTWHKADLITTLCMCKLDPFKALHEEVIESLYMRFGVRDIATILDVSNNTKTQDIADVIAAYPHMKREILLWNCCTVLTMCQSLKTFLKDNDLIDEDYSCGTQLKVRA